MGPFGRVGSCGCVSTSKQFGRVGPVDHVGPVSRVGPSGRVGPSSRVGPSGHVGQFDIVESSGLVGLYGSVPTLKGWFGYLAACVGNSLIRLRDHFHVLIDSLNQCKFPIV